ncbi:cupin domain-containing protein [Paraburkholderia sp. CNPSo 3272]|uniref:cupin domain-containing protein n=1 Tax=Paraburkholderia sp. CNPSo 3272 TaxID=2940931 RepID=UPI0020B68F78|nr:cupin domain-containing protein [Paraburkholderia sp. CNPSo 3272]MCP3725329.1 cupin domain-containing protein [Paraburkholderia sp. CNPSo 3272]
MIEPTDFLAMTTALRDGYRNEVVTTVNDHDIHVSVMEVPFLWHFHPDSDETFIGIEGVLIIDFEDGTTELRAGQLLTIPAGVRHRTRPGSARSINLTVEKANATTIRCDAPREG